MATSVIKKDYNSLVNELIVNGWSNVFIARANDVSFFIYIPQSVLKKSPTNTYSLSGLFNFSYYTVGGASTSVTAYTLKGVTMMASGSIQIETSIPSGVGTWSYGLAFPTTTFTVRNYS